MARAQATFDILLGVLLLLLMLSALLSPLLKISSTAHASASQARDALSLSHSSLNSGIIYCASQGTILGKNLAIPYAAGARNIIADGASRAPTINPGASEYESLQATLH
ncbi:hypothetical protein COU37_05935 [Candidatus Micrarchaeota archaeon CG10_big_fil_rev_8_21_14_0_10_45_29]|nr:MAG: hypothetical protein COU37_05935 [Candidatus Micrarchaeota archaeon CG10_big_fil_rev_8_21_14_0_10_45_29]